MIHDVKQIEPVTVRLQPAWVIPEPVEDPVGIEHELAMSVVRPRKSSPHRRTQARGFKTSMKLLQTLLEHQRDEVHARPIFFKQIAD